MTHIVSQAEAIAMMIDNPVIHYQQIMACIKYFAMNEINGIQCFGVQGIVELQALVPLTVYEALPANLNIPHPYHALPTAPPAYPPIGAVLEDYKRNENERARFKLQVDADKAVKDFILTIIGDKIKNLGPHLFGNNVNHFISAMYTKYGSMTAVDYAAIKTMLEAPLTLISTFENSDQEFKNHLTFLEERNIHMVAFDVYNSYKKRFSAHPLLATAITDWEKFHFTDRTHTNLSAHLTSVSKTMHEVTSQGLHYAAHVEPFSASVDTAKVTITQAEYARLLSNNKISKKKDKPSTTTPFVTKYCFFHGHGGHHGSECTTMLNAPNKKLNYDQQGVQYGDISITPAHLSATAPTTINGVPGSTFTRKPAAKTTA